MPVDYGSYQNLLFERRPDGVLLITLNRPDVYNAADEVMHTELARVWTDVAHDDETRVAVVTGAGRAFSAGGDLAMVERMAGDHDRVTAMLAEMSDLVYNMINCAKPIVSAINGVAVGAGLVVALLADISICADDARLGDGHVKLGVAAGDHAAIIWPLLCGLAKARYYLMTGEMVSGAEAERIGLVSKCLPRAEVLGEALRVAGSTSRPPTRCSPSWAMTCARAPLRCAPSARPSSLPRGHISMRWMGLRCGDSRSVWRLATRSIWR